MNIKLFHSSYLNNLSISMFIVEKSLFNIIIVFGLINFTINNSPPIFILIKLMSLLLFKI